MAASSATIFTQEYTLACLYTSDGLININASVRNNWKSLGKVGEFNEDWKVSTLSQFIYVAGDTATSPTGLHCR